MGDMYQYRKTFSNIKRIYFQIQAGLIVSIANLQPQKQNIFIITYAIKD